MLYMGLKSQREQIGDYIDDIDMKLAYTENKEKISKLEKQREKLSKVLKQGFGIVHVPKSK